MSTAGSNYSKQSQKYTSGGISDEEYRVYNAILK